MLTNNGAYVHWQSYYSAGPVEHTGMVGICPSQIFAENNTVLKFGLSEKHTKFEKIFLMVLTFTKEDYFKFCVLLRKSEL